MTNLPPAFASQEETPPQVLGEFKPVDDWQVHLNAIFYALRGGRIQDYYQTMASGDYRLAHALAQEFYEAYRKYEALPETILVHEWGCGNGNLAACFLSHLNKLDETLCRRTRYVLVDNDLDTLNSALAHPDLQPHRERIAHVQADAQDLNGVKDSSVHWIICNELWNDLRTKVMLRKDGDLIEEQIRPNLSDEKSKEFSDWFAFVKDFQDKAVTKLKDHPSFLDEIIWEKDYLPIDWKRVPYRKTITDFMKPIDDLVIVPVNLGAFATIKEARRILTAGGRFTTFDAGTPDVETVAKPDKPCYGLYGGQYSFIVNFALCESLARHLGATDVTIESQHEFVSRMLGHNLMTVVDLVSAHPSLNKLKPWERDKLILKTLRVLSAVYTSPYQRNFDYPVRPETPEPDREEILALLASLPSTGVPDPIAYLTEDEVLAVVTELVALGYDRQAIQNGLATSLTEGREIDYYRFSMGKEKNS